MVGETGKYVYFGIAEGLQEYIDPKVFTKKVIPIQINFWPILCKVFFFSIQTYSNHLL